VSRIDRQTVEKVASLAYLRLSEEEIAYYQKQLDRVLDYIQQLDSVEDTLPADWRADLVLPVTPERPDVAQPSNAVEKVLRAAPKVVGTAFQVPRIIE
jgi:aspartyl-tRNA(Asn)/glutamyl-tRNA(Gln) amidotransferase subunit C